MKNYFMLLLVVGLCGLTSCGNVADSSGTETDSGSSDTDSTDPSTDDSDNGSGQNVNLEGQWMMESGVESFTAPTDEGVVTETDPFSYDLETVFWVFSADELLIYDNSGSPPSNGTPAYFLDRVTCSQTGGILTSESAMFDYDFEGDGSWERATSTASIGADGKLTIVTSFEGGENTPDGEFLYSGYVSHILVPYDGVIPPASWPTEFIEDNGGSVDGGADGA